MKHDAQRWKSDYERDGYLVVEDLIDPQTLAALRRGIEKITDDVDALPPHVRKLVTLEKDFLESQPDNNDLRAEQLGNAVKRIMELPLIDRQFGELICYEPLLDVLETLFDSSEFAFHNYKTIIKAPRVSSRFVWHRDVPYLFHTTTNVITAMLCLDEMTEANGATVVLPGSHRVADEDVKPTDTDIPDSDLPKEFEHVMVTCPAGSAVLFHANIIHGGGANRSELPRRNVISIWTGPDTYPLVAERYAYQGLMPRSQDPARRRQVEMAFKKS